MDKAELLSYFPMRVRETFRDTPFEGIEEIRIRCGMPASITKRGGENIRIPVDCTREDMNECLRLLCRGSLYAHSEELKEGYLSLPDGARASVCGRAVIENGKTVAVSDLFSISVRIPCDASVGVSPILKKLKQSAFSEGMLLISLPGVGKTTVLRELAIRLSSSPYLKRVALVDARQEIFRPDRFRGCLCDVLSGYPKGEGISIAVRGLNPQLILCDEIGGEEESEAILSASCSGIPLVASCHAASIETAEKKPQIARLFSAGVFGTLCLLQRNPALTFTFRDRENK